MRVPDRDRKGSAIYLPRRQNPRRFPRPGENFARLRIEADKLIRLGALRHEGQSVRRSTEGHRKIEDRPYDVVFQWRVRPWRLLAFVRADVRVSLEQLICVPLELRCCSRSSRWGGVMRVDHRIGSQLASHPSALACDRRGAVAEGYGALVRFGRRIICSGRSEGVTACNGATAAAGVRRLARRQ